MRASAAWQARSGNVAGRERAPRRGAVSTFPGSVVSLRSLLLLLPLAALPAAAQTLPESAALLATSQALPEALADQPMTAAFRAALGRASANAADGARNRSVQATFTVTTAADAGPGSFREAITLANDSPGLDAIEFSIAGGGSYQEIFVQSLLPYATGPVSIDGSTQGCDTAQGLCIRIDGFALVDDPDVVDGGLYLLGGNSHVHGLQFTRFYQTERLGTVILASAANRVTGCYFGTDRTGMITDPDGTPNSGDELGAGSGGVSMRSFFGSDVRADDNVVGGTSPGERNVVAGSLLGSGIFVQSIPGEDPPAQRNRIVGNYIGTNATGTAALPNAELGIFINGGDLNVVEGNLLSGNASGGIAIGNGRGNVPAPPSPFGNRIVDNRVGTNADGTAALPNGTLADLAQFSGVGIQLTNGSDNVVSGNLVSGNLTAGIVLGVIPGPDAPPDPFLIDGSQVFGNRIGTDVTGALPIPNGVAGIPGVGFGVVLLSGAPNVTVTGNEIGTGEIDDANVVAFNTTAGVGLQGPGVTLNSINGNYVGVLPTGAPAPNGLAGILLRQGPTLTVIGEPEPEDFEDDAIGNFIGFQPAGIAAEAGTLSTIVAFNTFGGAPGQYLPVDLGADGPTPNDPGDADDGPNRLQNAPEILSATNTDDRITVRYRVDTAPANATYPLTVLFYGQSVEDGVLVYTPLGAGPYDAPGEATATFDNPLDGPFAVVGMAIDGVGNTSEMTLMGVPVAGESVAEAPAASVRVGPNPTRGAARVSLVLAEASEVSVSLVDMLGRTVERTGARRLGPGTHSVRVGAGLPAGVYVWRVQTGAGVETGRLTVVR